MHLGMSGRFEIAGAAARPRPGRFRLRPAARPAPRARRVRDRGRRDRHLLRPAPVRLHGPDRDRRARRASLVQRASARSRSAARSTPPTWRAPSPGGGRSVKATLLDQRIVAGLGNIYVCEALFRAGIAPRARRPDRCRPQAGRAGDGIRRRCWPRRSRPAARPCATTPARTARSAISSTASASTAAKARPA